MWKILQRQREQVEQARQRRIRVEGGALGEAERHAELCRRLFDQRAIRVDDACQERDLARRAAVANDARLEPAQGGTRLGGAGGSADEF